MGLQHTSELRVVFPHDPSAVLRVDIIAVHDVGETLESAWIYRKKQKQRVNNSLAAFASAAINHHDNHHEGEGGFHTAKNPAPSRHKLAVENSIKRWLASSAAQFAEQLPPLTSNSQAPSPSFVNNPGPSSPNPSSPGPSSPILAPVEVQDDDPAIFRMLVPPSESDDGTQDMQIERRVNWLGDLEMLPSEIPGACVMCYSYKTPVEVPSPCQYLTVTAEDLLKRTIEKRTSGSVDYGTVPIVLIGLGFGSLILQSALHILATQSRLDHRDSTAVLDMIAGIILLDAPSPSPDRARFPRSQSQERKEAWTLDWLGKQHNTSIPPTRIDIRSLWSKFSSIAMVYKIPIVWHYSPMKPSAGKVSSQRNPLDMRYTLTAVYLGCYGTSEPRCVIRSQTVCNRAPSQQI
jgi:hypothetical protein